MAAERRILVIEDEDKLRRVLELQLRSGGFEVELASNGEDGRKLASHADLILTDLRLPGMDGLSLMERLHEEGVTAPVIVMTAYGSPESLREARQLGAFAVLDKPFEMDALVPLVQHALDSHLR